MMGKGTEDKYKITPLDILKGVLFSAFLIGLGYLFDNRKYDTPASREPSPIFDFVFGNISNPYFLIGLFILFVVLYVIVISFCGVLANANVFGLHRHSFFENIWPKKTQEKTDKELK